MARIATRFEMSMFDLYVKNSRGEEIALVTYDENATIQSLEVFIEAFEDWFVQDIESPSAAVRSYLNAIQFEVDLDLESRTQFDKSHKDPEDDETYIGVA